MGIVAPGCGSRTELDQGTDGGADEGVPPPAGAYSPPLEGVVMVVAGMGSTCALTVDGAVSCWGAMAFGQVGVNPPRYDSCQSPPAAVPGVGSSVAIAGGSDFYCALSSAGNVWCWGANDVAQIAIAPSGASQYDWKLPTIISGLPPSTALDGAPAATCACSTGGTWLCWGQDAYNTLPAATPFPITASHVVQVTRGGSCVRMDTGGIECLNSAGQYSTVAGIPPAKDVAQDLTQACIVASNGEVWCWGSNRYGELGVSDVTATGPVAVPGIVDAVGVSTTWHYTCALLASGTVTCWGCSGDGTATCVGPPAEIPGVVNATQLSISIEEGCVRRADGTVLCWGGGATCP